MTTVERTWCDLAASGLALGALVAAGDAMVRRRAPLTSPEALREAVERHRGRRGIRVMSTALDLLDGRAESAPESEIRVALILAGLPRPAVAHPVLVTGATVHVDLAWLGSRLAVEYEGDHHRTDRDQWHYDIRRYDLLAEAGWRVIRATAQDYRDPSRLVARVAGAL